MNHQQIASKFDYLFHVVEVLLDETTSRTYQVHSYSSDGVKGGHEDQNGDIPVASEIGGSSAADGPSHDIDIVSASAIFEEVVIEG